MIIARVEAGFGAVPFWIGTWKADVLVQPPLELKHEKTLEELSYHVEHKQSYIMNKSHMV